MALSLASLRSSTMLMPPRILIYGPPGLGKTNFAAEFPAPVILDIEGGRPADVRAEDVPGWNETDLNSYDAVMEALQVLYTEDHDFQTVIIDTLDRFEPLLWARVCADNNWDKGIETPGYGKGYVAADPYWRDLLEGLNALRRDRNMTVVMVAHSTVERFDDPQTVSYSRFDIRLHKRALAMVQDEVDAIMFLNQDVTTKVEDGGFNKKRAHAEGGGNRWIYCEGRPAFTAKNRYGLPDRFIYRKGQGFAAIADALGLSPAPATDTPTTTKPTRKAA